MKALLIAATCLALTGCTAPRSTLPPPTTAQVDAFAVSFLDTIQAQSIAERREFCGYIYQNRDGTLQATSPRRGTFASCSVNIPQLWSPALAYYHTHAAYDPGFKNEVPSVNDLDSDLRLKLNGYVSTPGGRVWRSHYQLQTTQQICSVGCITSDPNFVPFQEDLVQQIFTREELSIFTGGA